MAEFKPTISQRQAIESRGSNILVSAGAGSSASLPPSASRSRTGSAVASRNTTAPIAAEAADAIKRLGGSIERIETYPIGEALHRVVVIRKTAATPRQYPRAFAKIKKQPL